MMKPIQKPIVPKANDLEDVSLISALLGLLSVILMIAFAISYLGGY